MAIILLDIFRFGKLLVLFLHWCAVPLFGSIFGIPLNVGGLAVRLRRFCEQMGITFVKLGQYFAMRPDILPSAICDELSKLFAKAPTMKYQQVRKILTVQLGRSPEEIFQSFTEEPVGAASIAQVHKAVTRDGEIVAVKVQRPEVARNLHSDLRNLQRLARVVDTLGFLGEIPILQMIEETAEFTLREVDFEIEGRTADRIRQTSTKGVCVPRIYWPMTTKRILTMEFIDGISMLDFLAQGPGKFKDLDKSVESSLDPNSVVQLFAEETLYQLFVVGFFHGDPHPANILILPDGRIAYIDFGIFGSLSVEQRRIYGNFIEVIAIGDYEKSYLLNFSMNDITEDTDLKSYSIQWTDVTRRWHLATADQKLRASSKLVAKYHGEMLEVMRRHGIRMRPNQLLFWRVLQTLDAVGHQFPIDFDLIFVLRDFFRRYFPSRELNIIESIYRDLRLGHMRALGLSCWPELVSVADDMGSRSVRARRHEAPVFRQQKARHAIVVAMGLLLLAFAVLQSTDMLGNIWATDGVVLGGSFVPEEKG